MSPSADTSSIYDAEAWLPDLAAPAARALGEDARVEGMTLLCEPKPLDDDTAKFLIRDRRGRPSAVLLGSPTRYPDAVEQYIGRSRAAAKALGPELGRVILSPLLEGRASGRSYAILPYNEPMSRNRLVNRLQRAVLTRPLLSWLRRATSATKSGPIAPGSDPALTRSLEHVAGVPGMIADARAAAERALRRASSGEWRPRRVLVHGDFWIGNLLIKPVADAGRRPGDRLTIIDWGGSRTDGAGMFDLLQFLGSIGAGPRTLRREVLAHCGTLDCDPADAYSHLALAMGELGQTLNQFPMERYIELAGHHFRALRAALPEFAEG
ncbi:phosphotransferase [Paludisphaera sp.]|uniref:phosphotransferase n=1 Tax=Paludisphaera sp. TaxID=2017432 RepID=UPI00301BE95A